MTPGYKNAAGTADLPPVDELVIKHGELVKRIAYHVVSRGTLDSTLLHPREVFKAALLANATAIGTRIMWRGT